MTSDERGGGTHEEVARKTAEAVARRSYGKLVAFVASRRGKATVRNPS
jgi:hypothetical protein